MRTARENLKCPCPNTSPDPPTIPGRVRKSSRNPSRHRKFTRLLLFALHPVLAAFGLRLYAADELHHWNQFRGPNGSGTIESAQPPLQFAADQPAWITALPPGHSSPILWGDQIFLTAVEDSRLVTLALDAKTGRILWRHPAPPVDLEPVHAASSPAASTPCADASSVYVYFGSYGLLCYSHDGALRWQHPIPLPKTMYGMATSPILYHNFLILVLDNDANLPDSQLSQSKVIAFEKNSGRPAWEAARPFNRSGWSTPAIWSHAQGADLVVLGNGRAHGYDLATGVEKWFVNGFAREAIAVPVSDGDHLILSASRQGGWGDDKIDPEPFWQAILAFDANRDQRVGRNEITPDFTLPLRPDLPTHHPGFGLPLPANPDKRRERQLAIFDMRDRDKDGFWTRAEFVADMTVGHGQARLLALKPGGRGDITDSHVAWSLRSGIPEIPSPLLHQGRLFLLRDGGVLSCVRGTDGELIYRERLGAGGQYTASPVAARGHLYLISSSGVLSVVAASDSFLVVHQSHLNASVVATPAIDSTTLYIRTAHGLVAFR